MADVAIQKVSYEANGQKISLDPFTVKKYLVNGNGNVTDQEIRLFMEICKGQCLNPFLRETYLVKYGNSPATNIVGKDAFMKRAEANEDYNGNEAGVIVVNTKGEIEERPGSFYLKNKEELVGGWAKVYFKSGKTPTYETVSLDEYTTGKSNWASKPATMIRKVALVHALREAFPNNLSQLYTAEEVGAEDLPTNKINLDEEQKKDRHVDEAPKPVQAIQKKQIFALAGEKGLATGGDVRHLEEYALSNGISLRGLTFDSANKLIELLDGYIKPVDVEYKEVNQEEHKEEVPQEDAPEEDTEENPF